MLQQGTALPASLLRSLWFAAGLLCLALGAHAEVRSVADEGLGLEIEGLPQRVVVLEYSFLDAALAAGVSPIGIADDGRTKRILPVLRAQLNDYTSVGLRGQPELETIASLKPDLIIADKRRHTPVYEELRAIAPTLLLQSYGASYPKLIRDGDIIAQALGRTDAFRARLNLHQQRMENAATRLAGAESMLFSVVTARGFVAHGPGSFASGVLERLGLTVALPPESEQSYQRISFEQLAATNPGWLFYSDYSVAKGGDNLAHWREHPVWPWLAAVKAEQIQRVDPLHWSLGRGLAGAEQIADDLVNRIGAR